MKKTSLEKTRMKVLLLENVHERAAQSFVRHGYTTVDRRPKALAGDELADAIAEVHFVGIRSGTRLTAEVLGARDVFVSLSHLDGTIESGFSMTEPEVAGSDPRAIRTTAVRDGDHWVLNGMKSFITLGGDADVLVTLARVDRASGRNGMAFFAVDRRSPGVTTKQIETYVNRPAPTYRVTFDDVRVPEARRVDAGFREIMAGFNRERVMVAARWLGHMQNALNWAREYASVRHQFGRPIGANQSIAFQLAQAHVDVEAARHLTYHAAAKWDSGVPIRDLILDVSSAKLFATQAVVRVTQTALHVGGGWGLTEELPAMRLALDALVAPVTVGSWEIQLRAIAREMGLPCD